MEIKLVVAANDATKELARAWYKSLKAALPNGVMTAQQVEDTTALMTTKKEDAQVIFIVSLTRELTDNEVEAAIEAFDAKTDIDFKVVAQRKAVDNKPEIEVEVEEGPLNELCTAWAKQKHDDWVKEKTAQGWRYGTKVSNKEQTHPLLRAWADLPEEYRAVDTSQVEQLLKLLNDSGYVLVKRDQVKPKA